MLHSDVEARVGVHQIFSILIFPSSFHSHDDASLRPGCLDPNKKLHSHTSIASASASMTDLLEKLRRGNEGAKTENSKLLVDDGYKESCVFVDFPCSFNDKPVNDDVCGLIGKELFEKEHDDDLLLEDGYKWSPHAGS